MSEGVLVIGAANFDVKGRMAHAPVMRSSNPAAIRTSLGGVARNVALNLARLGTPVTLLTAVGDDHAGHELLAEAQREGVDISRALIVPGEFTGTYLAALDPTGDMYLALDDLRVLRHITPQYLESQHAAFRDCEMVAMDLNLGEEVLVTAFRLAHQYGKRICVDPTSAALARKLRPHLHQVHIVTPNIREAEALLGDVTIRDATDALQAARRLVSRGVEIAVITQAERGACYATEHESGQFPALRIRIADTTGAGDALTASLIFGLLNQFSVSDALQLGIRAAALTLRSTEAVSPELSLDSLYGLDEENPKAEFDF